MIVFLVVIGLLIAAVLYGIFFLLFKLIWVLCKKQRNFWPLILAGAATLLVIVGVVWAAASTVNRYVVPFTPIIQAAQTRTEPVYGAQAYTDPRFGFGLTLYDGTVFSDWINLPDNGPSLLVGVDTNVFVTNSMQEDNTPLAAYLLVRAETKNTTGALELTQQFAQQARDTQFNGKIEVDEVAPRLCGPRRHGGRNERHHIFQFRRRTALYAAHCQRRHHALRPARPAAQHGPGGADPAQFPF